jgi:flagellar basal-body rod protein FlgF
LGASFFVNTSKTAKPAPAPDATVAQAQIEGSNVAPAESAVRLVALMRQFEMLQKAITLTSDMDKQSLSEVARVGSL